MSQKIYSLSALALLTLLTGCFTHGPQYVDEYDLVYSNYNRTYDFVSKGTYSLPDKVVKVTGKENQPPEFIKDVYGIPILLQIDVNMQQLGWTKVDVTKNPDLQLLPSAWESTTIVYGGYYGGYYCWYYPYYCGGGWYYPYTPVSSYSTGTLLMTLVDPALESADGSKQVEWSAAINGLLSGTSDISRIKKGIDQAFTQSSYLKSN